MICYDPKDSTRPMDRALLRHLSKWQKSRKKHKKHLQRVNCSTVVVDAEIAVLVDVINQIEVIRLLKNRPS